MSSMFQGDADVLRAGVERDVRELEGRGTGMEIRAMTGGSIAM
jgi:hypothetical protein